MAGEDEQDGRLSISIIDDCGDGLEEDVEVEEELVEEFWMDWTTSGFIPTCRHFAYLHDLQLSRLLILITHSFFFRHANLEDRLREVVRRKNAAQALQAIAPKWYPSPS